MQKLLGTDYIDSCILQANLIIKLSLGSIETDPVLLNPMDEVTYYRYIQQNNHFGSHDMAIIIRSVIMTLNGIYTRQAFLSSETKINCK